MSKQNNFFHPEDAQPASVSNPSVDDVLTKITDKVEKVNFHLLSAPNKEQIIQAIIQEHLETEGAELSYQEAAATVENDDINLNETAYKVLFINQLINVSRA